MAEEATYTYMPADGWYMTFPNPDRNMHRVFYRVALWRIDADGTVIGLISPRLGPGPHCQEPICLHEPPKSIDGQYVHRDDLSESDRKLIADRHFA